MVFNRDVQPPLEALGAPWGPWDVTVDWTNGPVGGEDGLDHWALGTSGPLGSWDPLGGILEALGNPGRCRWAGRAGPLGPWSLGTPGVELRNLLGLQWDPRRFLKNYRLGILEFIRGFQGGLANP